MIGIIIIIYLRIEFLIYHFDSNYCQNDNNSKAKFEIIIIIFKLTSHPLGIMVGPAMRALVHHQCVSGSILRFICGLNFG